MLLYCCKYCDFHTKRSSILLAEQVRLMYKVNILFLQLFFFNFFLKALWGIFSCIPRDKITWCHNLNNTRSFSVWGYLPLYSESVSYRRGALILKGTGLKFKYLIFYFFFLAPRAYQTLWKICDWLWVFLKSHYLKYSKCFFFFFFWYV